MQPMNHVSVPEVDRSHVKDVPSQIPLHDGDEISTQQVNIKFIIEMPE